MAQPGPTQPTQPTQPANTARIKHTHDQIKHPPWTNKQNTTAASQTQPTGAKQTQPTSNPKAINVVKQAQPTPTDTAKPKSYNLLCQTNTASAKSKGRLSQQNNTSNKHSCTAVPASNKHNQNKTPLEYQSHPGTQSNRHLSATTHQPQPPSTIHNNNNAIGATRAIRAFKTPSQPTTAATPAVPAHPSHVPAGNLSHPIPSVGSS
eukprot:m.90154 g.90154  ORF g.90154 m.90154 type:complete len:206 (+) comp14994_c0_seq2:159-776(+)